ncbi:hypothetical protein V8E55_011949 [Tylopilus felleus]
MTLHPNTAISQATSFNTLYLTNTIGVYSYTPLPTRSPFDHPPLFTQLPSSHIILNLLPQFIRTPSIVIHFKVFSGNKEASPTEEEVGTTLYQMEDDDAAMQLDLEEGELVESTSHSKLTKSQAGGFVYEGCKKKDNRMHQILKALYMGDNIHLHNVAKNPELLTLWKTAEARNRIPLCFNDPEILQSNPKWVFEPGIHLCIHQESNEVVFAARISSWNQMSMNQRIYTQETLSILMDWASAVPSITNNATQQGTKGPHGDGIKFAKIYDIMKAVGWHHFFERKKTLLHMHHCQHKGLYLLWQLSTFNNRNLYSGHRKKCISTASFVAHIGQAITLQHNKHRVFLCYCSDLKYPQPNGFVTVDSIHKHMKKLKSQWLAINVMNAEDKVLEGKKNIPGDMAHIFSRDDDIGPKVLELVISDHLDIIPPE